MTERTRIYLIRHGEVSGSEVFRYYGQTDVPLTEGGIASYQLLAERLSGKTLAACYTSDLSRCLRGAEIICSGRGTKPVPEEGLREISFGAWEGKSWTELAEDFPQEWRARQADPVNYRVPGGESLADLQLRVLPVMAGIVGRHRGEEAVVVAHGGVNRVILLNALGAPLSSMFRVAQDYGCLNIIDYYQDGNMVVTLLNG